MGEINKLKEAPYSLLSPDRLISISELLQSVNKLEGSIAEVGSYKGGVGFYLNNHSNGKTVYLCDTFEGIPMKDSIDSHPIGDFNNTSFKEVSNFFKDDSNVKVIKGIFPDSVSGIIKEEETFCFVHIDADQYESTKNSINFFYNKMVDGGIIVFDDYKWLKGVDKAVDDFFEDKKEKPIISVPMQCYIIKQ